MWRRECAASRLNRLVSREKGAQGQCINMPHWSLSCHLKIKSKSDENRGWLKSKVGKERKMLKVDFRDVVRERLFHHIIL